MSKWQAIVFDLDDTLYPESDFVLSGFRAVSIWGEENLGIPAEQGFAELEALFRQGVRGDKFDRWLALHEFGEFASKNIVRQLIEVYRQHHPSLKPYPGVPDLLNELHSKYKLGLISDGYLAVQQRKLAALNLAGHFDSVVFSDEWGRDAWKPSVKPFKVALERLEVNASRTVYTADNPLKDFLGARQLGISTIWVRHPGGEYTDLTPPTDQHTADIVVDSLDNFKQVLSELEEAC